MKVIHLVLLGFLATAGLSQNVAPVITPAKRDESLRQARSMIAPKDASLPTDLRDPFNSESFAAGGEASVPSGSPLAVGGVAGGASSSAVARPSGPRAGQDLLAAIAEALRPSGSFTLRGEPILTFGARRVKVGDSLSLTFEGADYAVVITAIKPPNFTFRLNQQDFTRSIK